MMLTFDLNEHVELEELEQEKVSNTALLEILDDKNTENDSNENHLKKIYKKLKNYDSRLTMKNQEKSWKYDMLKLKKYLFENPKINEYDIFHIIENPSYMSVKSWNEHDDTYQAEIFDKIKKDIEIGLDNQNKSIDVQTYIESVNSKKNNFNSSMNNLANVIKRVYSFTDGRFFTEEYISNIKDFLSAKLHFYKTDYSNTNTSQYTVFEIFYQVIVFKQFTGAQKSQIALNNFMAEILARTEFTPISDKICKKFQSYANQTTNMNSDTYIQKNIDTIVEIVFDSSNKEIDECKKLLTKPSNLRFINSMFELVNNETRYSQNKHISEKRIQTIIALCRASFLPEKYTTSKNPNKIQCKTFKERSFNSHGYFPKEKEKDRGLSMKKNTILYIDDTGKISRFSSRICLELIAVYTVAYYNKVDVMKERYKLEKAIDDFSLEILDMHDYNLISHFMDNCYPKLIKIVLPDRFLEHIMDTIMHDKLKLNVGFKDFLRVALIDSCDSDSQSPMYYVEQFYSEYINALKMNYASETMQNVIQFPCELKNSSYMITVSNFFYLFDAYEM